jgi:hypothetical protein
MPAAPAKALDLSFLSAISYVQAALHFEARGAVCLPPFGGSTLRGVLGRAFRRHLCKAVPPCREECGDRASCEYYRLFERDQDPRGAAGAIPKPYILEPPAPLLLEQIAAGSAVRGPFVAMRNPEGGLPFLNNTAGIVIPDGEILPMRITLLGQTNALLPAIVELLARTPLPVGGGTLFLVNVTDTAQSGCLWDANLRQIPAQPAQVRTLRPALEQPGVTPGTIQISFLTPTRLRAGDEYCFDPQRLAAHFWESALTRATRIHDSFCRGDGGRLPFYALQNSGPRLVRYKLYHYVLERMSHRQRKFMDFDGVVGSIWLEGDLGNLLPLARAAEVLHLGQKATFGLGRVRVWTEVIAE